MRCLANLLFVVGVGVGIGGCNSGPPAYHVSGTITFKGEKVPAGRIDFWPDFAQGNDGPQGYAIIKDGVFDTRKDGKAHAGGAMVIKIEGFDGKADNPQHFGTPITEVYEFKRELQRGLSEENFDLPASAALKQPFQKSPS